MNSTQAILHFAQSIYDHSWQFLVAITAIGTIAMAILQTAKDMIPLRNWFQQRFLNKWLGDCAAKAPKLNAPYDTAPDASQAGRDLVTLATAGDADAFYDLPIEKLCGQAAAAAQAVLDYPSLHPDLLRCLASRATDTDLQIVLAPPAGTTPQAAAEARGRVIHQTLRALDGMQISCAYKWQRTMQLSAFAISFLLTEVALLLYMRHANAAWSLTDGRSFAKVIFVSLAAGFLAPFANDLKAAAQKLKNP